MSDSFSISHLNPLMEKNEGFKTKNMMPETTFEWGALEHNNSNEVSNKFNSHLDHNMKIDTNNNNNTKIIIQLNYPHF